jgi:Pectate lyase superfamily protein/Carboxypeptidase regulatory-like domain
MATNSQESILASFAPILNNDFQTPPIKVNRSRPVTRGLVNFLLVLLAFAFVSAGADASTRGTARARHVSVADAAVTISLADYGAVGDGVTDDGPALQSALNALADAGGGNLFVPDGHYAVATPVSVDFLGRASSVTIQGTPSSSPDNPPGDFGAGLNLTAEFLIRTGEGPNAITLRNLDTLLVRDLGFIGNPAVADDAKIVLTVSAINDATFLRCEFYGLASFAEGGAILYAEGGGLQITDSAFLGCAGNSGFLTPIVQIYNWKKISVTGTRFVDYGTRPGYFSKTTYMSPFSWISVGGAAPLTNISPRRDIVISDVLLDEGAYYALSVRPGLLPVPNGGAISLVYLSKLYVNVTNLGEVGLRIHYVDNVFIEDSHFGWSHNSRGAMHLAYVKNAVLNHIECVDSANTIIADPTVAELSVINSVYETLDSQAPVTRVTTTPHPEDGPAQYVNQKYLEILGHAPDVPGYAYWSQKRARCSDDAQCTTDEELLNYLNGNPAATFSISGRLLDSDGVPIAAATVSLGGTHTVDTLTDADGKYAFTGLATSDEYAVTPSKTFYTFNATGGAPGSSSRSFITPGGDQTADFTGTLANYSIQGRFNDSNQQSMSGANVTLTGGPEDFEPESQTTNAAGDYAFTGLPAGYTYTLTATKNFYTFSPSVQTLLLAGDTINTDFVGSPLTFSIAGQVTDGADPLSDATVTLSGDVRKITATDSGGNYRFDGVVAGGTYVVTVTKQHYTFVSQAFDNLLSNQLADFTGSIVRYVITGSISAAGNGLGGVSLTLSGDQSATFVTTSTGNYAFTVDAGGNYTVTATKSGYVFAPQAVVFNDLGQNVFPSFIATPQPILLTDSDANRAIAFNSVTMLTEPFDLSTPFNFGGDQQTRIILFGSIAKGAEIVTAHAEDAQGHVYPLTVEYLRPLAGVAGIIQINLKLDDQLPHGQDVRVNITVNGATSNPALIRIN